MKAALICPGPRPEVGLLGEPAPLACLPAFGESLVEYWLSTLAASGIQEVMVLSTDRTEQLVQLIGDGARWGLKIHVSTESRELTAAQALLKYKPELDDVPAEHVIVLDHFPGLPGISLFADYAQWFAGLRSWISSAMTPDRVGVREARPGVWLAANAHVSSRANLVPPCWVGQRAFVGARATIGPCAIIEDGCFIEPGAEIGHSQILPFTFVGPGAKIVDSVAAGNVLINWKTGSSTAVPDPFLLCALRQIQPIRRTKWLARLAQFCAGDKEEVEVAFNDALINKEG